MEIELSRLVRVCGPEPDMRYRKTLDEWEASVAAIVSTLDHPARLPPLIARPDDGKLELSDGNHRHAAMTREGWNTGWTLIGHDRDERFRGSWRRGD